MNLMSNRALAPPLSDRVEQQLVTAVRVLLPPVELVVASERHALPEAAVRVGRPAHDVATHLDTERHVEILGHVRLGPDLLLAVGGVNECSVLDGLPAEERIVTDERSDLAVGARHRDTPVDTAGEVCDTVLEVVVGDLHDVRLVLDDSDGGALGELAGGIAEAIFGDDGVRVDNEDNLSDTARLAVRRPRAPATAGCLVDLLDGELESFLFEIFGAIERVRGDDSLILGVTVLVLHAILGTFTIAKPSRDRADRRTLLLLLEEDLEVLLSLERKGKTVVHVRSLLETTGTLVTVVGAIMLGTSDPSNVVVGIVGDTGVTFFIGEETETVIVDKDSRSTTLASVRLHGLLERLNRGCEHRLEGLLVDGHLDGDVRKVVVDDLVRTRLDS
jgi:hypothetical protein